MPKYRITSPDGKTYNVTAPEGATKEDALAYAKSHFAAQETPETPSVESASDWSEVPGKFVSNLPKSTLNAAKGAAEAIVHPVDTASNIVDIAAGGLRNVAPESVLKFNDLINSKLGRNKDYSEVEAKAGAVGQHFKKRYGSTEGIKSALANDPAGVMLDASVLLTGGGSLLSKAPGLASTGAKITQAGRAIDPLLNTIKAGAKAAKLAGKYGGELAAHTIGNLATHTGGDVLIEAAKAGKDLVTGPGVKSRRFQDAMIRGADAADVVDQVKGALKTLQAEDFSRYKANMAPILASGQQLSWKGINEAASRVLNKNVHKGININPGAEAKKIEIVSLIGKFKNKKLATPEDFDALKRGLGNIYRDTKPHTAERQMAQDAYHAVKQAIGDQLPGYLDAMKDSEEAFKRALEIEKGLSLGSNTMSDTALRKLFSISRNNANTNFGNRQKLLDALESQPSMEGVKSELAGHALNSLAPRGLGKVIASGTAGASIYNPSLLGALAVQSPHLMGQTAYGLGAGAGASEKIYNALASRLVNAGIPPKAVPSLLYQLEQPKEGKQ